MRAAGGISTCLGMSTVCFFARSYIPTMTDHARRKENTRNVQDGRCARKDVVLYSN